MYVGIRKGGEKSPYYPTGVPLPSYIASDTYARAIGVPIPIRYSAFKTTSEVDPLRTPPIDTITSDVGQMRISGYLDLVMEVVRPMPSASAMQWMWNYLPKTWAWLNRIGDV